jgi:hypothetical protein
MLVTRSTIDEFTASVATAADQHREYEQIRIGPRFVGDGFETLVYLVDGGAYYQTTFAYWRQVLGARADEVGLQPASPPTPGESGGATDVGTGVMADGTNMTLTTNPLLDAWASAGGQ